MKNTIVLTILTALMMGSISFARNTVDGEFVVQAPAGMSLSDFQKQLLDTHSDVKLIDKRHKIFLVKRPSVERVGFAFQQVTSLSPAGTIIEPNMEFSIDSLPNDPGLGLQMNLVGLLDGQTSDCAGVLVSEAKSIGMENVFGSSLVLREQAVVAVIDTGVNLNHPDLEDAIFINDVEAGGTPGVDDDGNGYIDDISGFNFVDGQAQGDDDNGHGSHVAGVIAATTNNNQGVAGISDQTLILPLKFLGANGSGTLAGAIEAIEYARSMNVNVINASFGGGGFSELFQTVINDAAEDGILFVAASGNSNIDIDKSPTYPAAYENVIAVAATQMNGNKARFSNYGSETVSIAAPGEHILSPILQDEYGCLSGTSMAAPHVAGALALAKSLYPEESSQELKGRLLNSADTLTSLRGLVRGAKFLRVDKMLQ